MKTLSVLVLRNFPKKVKQIGVDLVQQKTYLARSGLLIKKWIFDPYFNLTFGLSLDNIAQITLTSFNNMMCCGDKLK